MPCSRADHAPWRTGMVGAQDGRGFKSEGEGRDVTGLSDVALVVATARGHRDALAEAYRRHAPQVYGLARRVCGEDRAREVVQQVFLEMWEKPHRYNPDRGSLRTFLLTQAYGRSIETTGLTRSAGDKVWRGLEGL